MSALTTEIPPVHTAVTVSRPRWVDRIDAMPAWLGATIGVLLILAIWIASVTLFQASHAVPTPPSVVAYFFDGTAWSNLWALTKVRLPAALPYLFAAIRISVPGSVVGAMLGEWLTGFTGLGGVLADYRVRANYGGVWTVVALAIITSIVAYLVASIVETAVLAKWGPNAGKK